MRRRLGNRRGQALVEFALLLPVLALLLMAILEFGRAWNAKQVLTDGAREGARLAVVANPTITDTSQVNPAIRLKLAAAGMDTSAVTIAYPNGCRFAACTPQTNTGDITSVELTYPFQFVVLHRLMQLAVAGSSGDLTLRTTARMRTE